jgi:hypothetical protein
MTMKRTTPTAAIGAAHSATIGKYSKPRIPIALAITIVARVMMRQAT